MKPLSASEQTQSFWKNGDADFDITVIGAGIQGAMTYNLLSEQGYKVLLLDKGDFGGGTSQSSALSLWGGLLYLRQGELNEVLKLSKARESLKKRHSSWVSSHDFRYIYPEHSHSRSEILMKAGLFLYWLLSAGKQEIPRRDPFLSHEQFLQSVRTSFVYQEAQLVSSDARFVLDLILAGLSTHSCALNYTKLESGNFNSEKKLWILNICNLRTHMKAQVKSKWVINASGVWSDSVNRTLSLNTPYSHLRSKGVSISFQRHSEHKETLIFDSNNPAEEGMSLVPWGPVSVWGSTETLVDESPNEFSPTSDDITYLINTINQHLKTPITTSDIISTRTGVRPIPVTKEKTLKGDPLYFSKKFIIHTDAKHQALSIYGGKITSALLIAREIRTFFEKTIPSSRLSINNEHLTPEYTTRIGYHVPTPEWCRENEYAISIEDYVRRRTNLSQWVPNGGFGKLNENEDEIQKTCSALHANEEDAKKDFINYKQQTILENTLLRTT